MTTATSNELDTVREIVALRRHLDRACEERDAWELAHDAAALNLSLADAERDAARAEATQDRNRLADSRDAARAEAERLRDALAGLVYCADCWDNPAHSVCEKHLAPARAALAGSPQDERSQTQKEDAP